MGDLPFSLEPMPLLGVAVSDFDAEISRYSELFGVEFRVFTAGVDYHLSYESSDAVDTSAPLPANLRLAVDTSDLFELVDLPGVPEGIRNIHYRVDNLELAVEHFRAKGLTLLHIVRAGLAREAIFDATSLNGVRLCLLAFEGASFAEALAASSEPRFS